MNTRLVQGIILLILINGVILYVLTSSKDFEQSAPWKEYLSVFNSTDANYCKRIPDKSTGQLGIPWEKEERIIFTDFSENRLTYGILNTLNTLADEFSSDVDIYYTVDISWHYKYQIGKNFLCRGQRYNHIPGSDLLSNKADLVQHIQSIGQDPWRFFHRTVELASYDECFSVKTDKYIVRKSVYTNLLKDFSLWDPFKWECPQKGKVATEFFTSPLLYYSSKFEIRTFMFIASMDPLIVLFHDGFVKVASEPYSEKIISSHLPGLSKKIISFKELRDFFAGYHQFDIDWLANLKGKMKEIMKGVVRATEMRFVKHPSVFELMAVDFEVDTDLNVKIVEIGLSPAISSSDDIRRKRHTELIKDLINIEFAILYRGDIDSMIAETKFEWVIDDRSYFN